jgi:anti-sigma factor RsiW
LKKPVWFRSYSEINQIHLNFFRHMLLSRPRPHLSEGDLVLFIDHEMAPRLRRRAEGHLARCCRCRGNLADLEAACKQFKAFIESIELSADGPGARREQLAREVSRLSREEVRSKFFKASDTRDRGTLAAAFLTAGWKPGVAAAALPACAAVLCIAAWPRSSKATILSSALLARTDASRGATANRGPDARQQRTSPDTGAIQRGRK